MSAAPDLFSPVSSLTLTSMDLKASDTEVSKWPSANSSPAADCTAECRFSNVSRRTGATRGGAARPHVTLMCCISVGPKLLTLTWPTTRRSTPSGRRGSATSTMSPSNRGVSTSKNAFSACTWASTSTTSSSSPPSLRMILTICVPSAAPIPRTKLRPLRAGRPEAGRDLGIANILNEGTVSAITMAGISKAQLTMTGRASNADGVAHDGPLTIQVSLNLDASGCGGGGVDALAEPGGEQNLHAFIKQDHRVGRVAAHYVVEEVAHSYLHRGHPPVVAIAAD